MKKVLLFILVNLSLIGVLFLSVSAQAVNVKGYYKRNGTYVAPHTRTAPDGNKWNNRSSW